MQIIQKKFAPTRKAFTLVETLVAIAILMIAVAGPLVVASKGLNAALHARDQMIASYLAQETMEMVKNIRDNNLNGGSTWAYGLEDCTSQAESCEKSPFESLNHYCDGTTGGCKLYYTDADGYTADTDGAPTLFSRYFYLSDIDVADGSDAIDEKRVTVVVSWNQGTIENEIVLYSEITNATR